jgi:transposase
MYLREEHYPTGPLVVILDVYPAHRTDAIRGMALALGIELVFIPPGCTDRLQPLDRRVFGVVKAYARQQW